QPTGAGTVLWREGILSPGIRPGRPGGRCEPRRARPVELPGTPRDCENPKGFAIFSSTFPPPQQLLTTWFPRRQNAENRPRGPVSEFRVDLRCPLKKGLVPAHGLEP